MELTMFHNILLLSLAKAYDGRKNAFIMLEEVTSVVNRFEQATPQVHGGHASRVTGALITLEGQKLIRLDRGRVHLTEAGMNSCQGLQLPPDWSGLPAALKTRVKQ